MENQAVDKEYFELLQSISDKIGVSDDNDLQNQLDFLYDIKPVRLEWFIAKARLMKKNNENIEEIKKTLLKKYQLMYDSEKLQDIINCLILLNEDNPEEQKRLSYHLEKKENSCDTVAYYDNRFSELCEKYRNITLEKDGFLELIFNCYIRNDFVLYVLLIAEYNKRFNENFKIQDWVAVMPGIQSLIERIMSGKSKTYVFINSYNDTNNKDLIISSIKFLNPDNDIVLIDDVVTYETNNNISIRDTLNISIENVENNPEYTLIHPVEIISDKEKRNNIAYIIEYLYKNIALENLMYIFSSGNVAEELCASKILQKNTERLTEYKVDYFEDRLCVCWSGDYLSYMSEFYDEDIHPLIDAETDCKFSIVIPVRNSIETFRYTLQTCMELNYKGSYEIVISDNSTTGNTNVYDFVSKINNPHIKYYKVPRELPIPKSFEYAFLHTKGEFVFSIGADDGVLPWALDVLEAVINKCPDEKIIGWERGFYGWPNFNGIQNDQFIIPCCRNKKDINVKKIPAIKYIKSVFESPNTMYGLPLLYINSGFKRSYLRELIKKTGRLWDGHVQDLYIGAVNIAINNKILNIEYPLTIAGMSENSMGKDLHSSPKLVTEICGSSCNIVTFSKNERLIPQISVDVQLIQNAILRCVSRGILPKNILDCFTSNLNELFEQYFHLYNKQMVYYEEYINLYRNCLKQIDENKLYEFDRKWYTDLFSPEKIHKDINTEIIDRCYEPGFLGVSLQLNASEFDVKNICDAKDLFVKIWGKI